MDAKNKKRRKDININILICKYCNQEYKTKFEKQLYCSNKCQAKDYYSINQVKNILRAREYRINNRESYLKTRNKYNEKNKIKRAEQCKEWRINNREKVRAYKNNKRKNDILYRISESSRERIRRFLKSKGFKKNTTSFKMIGCSPLELKEHLEKQFLKGMNWLNYGEWHIDHIIPLSRAESEKDIFKLCNYQNLQPLWAEDNLKKSDK